MIRKIITIDEDKCNGCGLCATACHEGAIEMINGKAKLIRDDYCDGLGACLPSCPTNALSFENREAAAFDEEAVKERLAELAAKENTPAPQSDCSGGGCPGSRATTLKPKQENKTPMQTESEGVESQLRQWPIQIKLVPLKAPYFENANLLIAADCTAFAYGNFHNKFIKNHIALIGCPKLDEGDYSEKLTELLRQNNFKSVTIVRMEVPCCGGIQNAAIQALQNSGKMIPWQVVTISVDGEILEN